MAIWYQMLFFLSIPVQNVFCRKTWDMYSVYNACCYWYDSSQYKQNMIFRIHVQVVRNQFIHTKHIMSADQVSVPGRRTHFLPFCFRCYYYDYAVYCILIMFNGNWTRFPYVSSPCKIFVPIKLKFFLIGGQIQDVGNLVFICQLW